MTIGHQETFDDDLDDKGELRRCFSSRPIASRAPAARARAARGSVVLIIKYDDFRQITRRPTLGARPATAACSRAAIELLARCVEAQGRPRAAVRARRDLDRRRDAPRQLGFDEAERARGERLGDTIDKVSRKVRQGSRRRAALLSDED